MTFQKTRQRILIVDDVPTNIKILAEVLGTDHEILFAIHGEKGLQLAQEQCPDLILLDIMMPEMDGYTVCKALKMDVRTKNIPVIFISAKSQPEDELQGLDLGAVDYITKPFQIPIVRARVRTHLDLKRKYDLLESLASLDGLTEIANRRRFDEAFDDEWRRGLRSLQPLSLIMIDIDYFKLYNDHYGHAAGDSVLKRIAHAMKDSLNRAGDLLARYGGEEFVILLPDTNLSGATIVAETARSAVEQLHLPHAHSHISDHITLSLGIAATVPSADSSPMSLLQAADHMLYEAKNGGRNRIQCATGTDAVEGTAAGGPGRPSPNTG